MFGKRGNFRRSSARATIGHANERRINITPIKPPQIRLKALPFEVPHNEGKALFVGREWLFKDIEMVNVFVIYLTYKIALSFHNLTFNEILDHQY